MNTPIAIAIAERSRQHPKMWTVVYHVPGENTVTPSGELFYTKKEAATFAKSENTPKTNPRPRPRKRITRRNQTIPRHGLPLAKYVARASQITGKAPTKRLKARRKLSPQAGYFPNPATLESRIAALTKKVDALVKSDKRVHATMKHNPGNVYPLVRPFHVIEPRSGGKWALGDGYSNQTQAVDAARSLAESSGKSHRVASRAWVKKHLPK